MDFTAAEDISICIEDELDNEIEPLVEEHPTSRPESPNSEFPPAMASYGSSTSGLDSIKFLHECSELKVAAKQKCYTGIFQATVYDGNGGLVLNVDVKKRGTAVYLGASTTTFLSPVGQIILNCERERLQTSVTSGDFVLGDISKSSIGSTSDYNIMSKTGGSKLEILHRPKMLGQKAKSVEVLGRNLLGVLFPRHPKHEFKFYSDGENVATIDFELQNEESLYTIKFLSPQLDTKAKALILSASMMFHELYFSNQWSIRNVGLRRVANIRFWIYLVAFGFKLFSFIKLLINSF